MTVVLDRTQELFLGNDVATAFSFGIKSQLKTDVTATHISLTSVETKLVQDIDFSVVLNADGTSTVTFPLGTSTFPTLATNETLLVRRSPPRTQAIKLDNQGPYNPKVVENALDKVTQIVQDVVPDFQENAGKLMFVDDDGIVQGGITNDAVISILNSGVDIGEFTSIAAMKAIDETTLSNNDSVRTLGYYAPGDSGGGVFFWNSTSTDADDGVITFQPDTLPTAGRWKRITPGFVTSLMAGARHDNSTDDTVRLQALLDSGVKRLVISDTGTDALISSGLELTVSNTELYWYGSNNYINCTDQTFVALTIPANSCVFYNPAFKNAGTGIKNGSDTNKCLTPVYYNVRMKNCKIGFHANFGNVGKIFGIYCEGDDTDLTDIGLLWQPFEEDNNCNQWVVYGARCFDCSIGLSVIGRPSDNSGVSDNWFDINSEDHSNVGVNMAGGFRNKCRVTCESGVGGSFGYRDSTGFRSNEAILSGVQGFDPAFGFKGYDGRTVTKQYITYNEVLKKPSKDLTATKTQEFTASQEYFTVENTSGSTQTVKLTEIDGYEIGPITAYIYAPSTNADDIIIELNDPAGSTFVDSGTNQFRIIPQENDQLYELRRLATNKYLITNKTRNSKSVFGDFTPFYDTTNGDASGITHDIQDGHFQRVDDMLWVEGRARTDAWTGAGTGNIIIGGFPFIMPSKAGTIFNRIEFSRVTNFGTGTPTYGIATENSSSMTLAIDQDQNFLLAANRQTGANANDIIFSGWINLGNST